MKESNHRYTCDSCKNFVDVRLEDEIFRKGWTQVDSIQMIIGIETSHRVNDDRQPIKAENAHFCSVDCFVKKMRGLFPERAVGRSTPVKEDFSDQDFSDSNVESFQI